MKIAICSTIALAALCGLALADLFDDDYGYSSWGGAGYGSGISSWGGAGYGGGSWGGAGYGGGKHYIPVPVGGGAKGGSGFGARTYFVTSYPLYQFYISKILGMYNEHFTWYIQPGASTRV